MGPPVYVDLAYIPNHCSGKNTDPEFFKRIRASYYVVSGNDAANGEPSRAVLDALLEGKSQWGENLQVGDGNAKGCVMLPVSQVLMGQCVSRTDSKGEHREEANGTGHVLLCTLCTHEEEDTRIMVGAKADMSSFPHPPEGREPLEIMHSSPAAGQAYPQAKPSTIAG